MIVAAFGRTRMLLNTIRALAAAGHEIAVIGTAVASDTDGADERDFERCAMELGAAFFLGSFRVGSEAIRRAVPEIGISMNWPAILGEDAVSLFPGGILNVHAGDLPRYRGNACPNWAILNGEARIGLCVHKMTPGLVDAGPVLVRRYFDLGDELDIGDVHQWMETTIPEMFVEAVDAIQHGTALFVEQPTDPELSFRCFPRRPEDGAIDWTREDVSVSRMIRASARPFHGAFTTLEGKQRVRIWRARAARLDYPYCAIPGQVLLRGSAGPLIACGIGCIEIVEASFEDGNDAIPAINGSLRNRLK